jgi:hypothetical protein
LSYLDNMFQYVAKYIFKFFFLLWIVAKFI